MRRTAAASAKSVRRCGDRMSIGSSKHRSPLQESAMSRRESDQWKVAAVVAVALALSAAILLFMGQ